MKILLLVLFGFVSLIRPTYSLEPDEILDNKDLEARARTISAEIRCLVCRNENIDESNAELARDLRMLIRERLLFGDTNEQILKYLEIRYGDYIFLRPKLSGSGLILWSLVPLTFLLSVLLVAVYIRKNHFRYKNQMLGEGIFDKELSRTQKEKIDKYLNS